jgi:putative hydrolase of the HAD superfamily
MRAVFFDVGGTLVHIDHARIAAAVQRVLGRALVPESFVLAEYAGRAAMEAFIAANPASRDGQRWDCHFRGMLGALGLGDEEFDRCVPAIVASHRERHLWCVVPPGTAEALESLAQSGWYVACVSNADGKVAQLLEGLGLLQRVKFVVDSGVVGVEKPDPRIFAMAVERAGIPAGQTYYVGDVHAIDVRGAEAAGLVPVLLDPLGRYGALGCRTTPDVPTFCRELVSLRTAA